MSPTLKERLTIWENLVREGQGAQVRRDLRRLNLAKVPREEVFQVANLANRLGASDLTLRILNPIVRAPKGQSTPKSPAEVSEYAWGLARVGSFKEAADLLESIDDETTPKALLYRAFVAIFQWEYREAIGFLKEYLRRADLDDYNRTIAEVNQAACHIFIEENADARKLLERLRETCEEKNYKLLSGNVQELLAQVAMHEGNYQEALDLLDRGAASLADVKGLSEFFIRKWRVIVELKQSKEGALNGLQDIRNEAISLEHWESVRDCDFYRATYSKDEDILRFLYFGTPFHSYRKRLEHFIGENPFKDTDNFAWIPNLADPKLAGSTNGSIDIFDVFAGTFANRAQLKKGQVLHRLLQVLSRDYYRPCRVGVIFSEVFPDEFYNPVTSPDRIYKSIRRLRKWFKEKQVPLEVLERHGQYRLNLTSTDRPVALLVRAVQPKSVELGESSKLAELFAEFGTRPFSTKEAAKLLEVNHATISRLFQAPLQDGRLQRLYSGPKTKYIFQHIEN